MRNRTGPVADHLDLNMARLREQPFDVEGAVTKRLFRLGTATGKRLGKLLGPGDRAHSPATAAGHRLDHDGAARSERGEKILCLRQTHRARRALNHRNAAALDKIAGSGLVTEQRKRFR
jgi:hypothetical protein